MYSIIHALPRKKHKMNEEINMWMGNPLYVSYMLPLLEAADDDIDETVDDDSL